MFPFLNDINVHSFIDNSFIHYHISPNITFLHIKYHQKGNKIPKKLKYLYFSNMLPLYSVGHVVFYPWVS